MRPIREITYYCKQVYQKLGNRRRHERLPVEGTMTATWKSRYYELITHTCGCLNLSQKGIAIVSEEPAFISTDVYVLDSRHGVRSFATARYCTRRAAGYQIGLKFRADPVA